MSRERRRWDHHYTSPRNARLETKSALYAPYEKYSTCIAAGILYLLSIGSIGRLRKAAAKLSRLRKVLPKNIQADREMRLWIVRLARVASHYFCIVPLHRKASKELNAGDLEPNLVKTCISFPFDGISQQSAPLCCCGRV